MGSSDKVIPGTWEIWVANANSATDAADSLHDDGWRALSLEETVDPVSINGKSRYRYRGAVMERTKVKGRRVDGV